MKVTKAALETVSLRNEIKRLELEQSIANEEYAHLHNKLRHAIDNNDMEQAISLDKTVVSLKQSIVNRKKILKQLTDQLSHSPSPSTKSRKNRRKNSYNSVSTYNLPDSYKRDETRIRLLSPAYYSNNAPNSKFAVDNKIQHKSFGTGTVISKNSHSILVLFSDGVKREIQNPDFLVDIGIIKIDGVKTSYTTIEESMTHTSPAPSVSPQTSTPSKADFIQFRSYSDTLYVYSGRIKCIRDKHNMVCTNAHIETASGETAVLNVNCCLNCNRFYISYDEYARYLEKYKSLLTRIVLVDENGNSTFANSLAVESTLKLCGYSVSQEKGFTSKERATLLAHIIHNGIVSKPDVIQHLNWLIRMNGKKVGNAIAKEKWEEDLAFVRNLDTATQANHTIRSVAPYPSARKNRR